MAIRVGLDNIEGYLKRRYTDKALPLLLKRFGILVWVHREVDGGAGAVLERAYKVYGTYSNRSVLTSSTQADDVDPGPNVKFQERILPPAPAYVATGLPFGSDFDDTYITVSPTSEILPGDRFECTSITGVHKVWKVLELDAIGVTQTFYRKYKVGATN